jgi:hypothetical protein
MGSIVFSLPAGADITPRSGMTYLSERVKNAAIQPNCRICAIPSTPVYTGLIITSTETSTPPYSPGADTATFDVLITNDAGVTLTTLVMNASHDSSGYGSFTLPTMPASLANGASSTVVLTYNISGEIAPVEITFYVTGTKPDTSTETSNTLVIPIVTT